MEMYILVFKEQHALTTDSKRELNKTELVDLLKTFLVMTEADKSEVFFKTFNKNQIGGLETEILEAENKRQRPNLSKRKLIFKYKEENERETSSGSSSDSDSDSSFYSSSDSDSDSDF
jgi:hypothetical protein